MKRLMYDCSTVLKYYHIHNKIKPNFLISYYNQLQAKSYIRVTFCKEVVACSARL